jgi:hypothetical protein
MFRGRYFAALLLLSAQASGLLLPVMPPTSRVEDGGSQAGGTGGSKSYEFISLATVYPVAMVREHDNNLKYFLGDYDQDGCFVKDSSLEPMQMYLSGPNIMPRPFAIPRWADEEVYEYRCGSLVRGRLTGWDEFTPEFGSTVLSLDEYMRGRDRLRMYNLRGYFVQVERPDVPAEDRTPTTSRPRLRSAPDMPVGRPAAGESAGRAGDYEFVGEYWTLYYGLQKPGGRVAVFQVNDRGDFIPLHGLEDVDPTKPYDGPAYTVVNRPHDPRELVYEYRSGRLILGRFNEDFKFVPEPNSRVRTFTAYRYGPDAIRIYNLPGRFVRRLARGDGQ